MFRYFDIHTHGRYSESGVIVVENIRLFHDHITPPSLFSIGIHPYDVHKAINGWDIELQDIASRTNCVAIGEVGLDKRIGNIELQTQILTTQISIAQQLRKPLIIHCVRAESEILKLTRNISVPTIFHSYPKYGAQIAARDNVLFSLTNKNITHPDVVKIPISKILFETDDDNIPIQDVYRNYCSVIGLTLENVGVQIEQNFDKIFNI